MREANRLFLGNAHQGIQYIQKALWDAGLITDMDSKKRKIAYFDEDTKTGGTIFLASYKTSEWRNVIRGRRFLEICIPVEFTLDNEDSSLLLSRLERVDSQWIHSSFSRRIMEVTRPRYYNPNPILPYDSLSSNTYFPLSCWRKGIEVYFEDIDNPTDAEFELVQMIYGGDFSREPSERWKERR